MCLPLISLCRRFRYTLRYTLRTLYFDMDSDRLFQAMVEQRASDLFLKVGACPSMRVRGRLQPCGAEPLNRAELLQFASDLMGPERQRSFQTDRELNFAFERPEIGRFRANVLWERGRIALVIRRVQDRVLDFEALHLPAGVLRRLADEAHGLVLITGPTASGKSTTVASFIEFLNHSRPCHVVTLEDPVEFVFTEQQAVINQREVGVDTRSFSDGLKNVLRQSPDVLYLSDIRDRETMEAALVAAEAGQLVISCIHTTNAVATIERVIALFPPHQQHLFRLRLSMVLKGILSLRLLPRRDGQGQIPSVEVLVMTPTIRELIREGQPEQIPALLRQGASLGMQTMTQSLYHLITRDIVTLEEAVKVVDSRGELERALQEIRGISDGFERSQLP